MKNLRDHIALRAHMLVSNHIRPHVRSEMFHLVDETVWDWIDDRVWFGVCVEVGDNLRLR